MAHFQQIPTPAQEALPIALGFLQVGYHADQPVSDSEPVGTERSEIITPSNHVSVSGAGVSVSVPAWLPIESAPKDGTHVLTWSKRGVIPASYRVYDKWGMEPGGNEVTPTHWMPLPVPPSPLSDASQEPRT